MKPSSFSLVVVIPLEALPVHYLAIELRIFFVSSLIPFLDRGVVHELLFARRSSDRFFNDIRLLHILGSRLLPSLIRQHPTVRTVRTSLGLFSRVRGRRVWIASVAETVFPSIQSSPRRNRGSSPPKSYLCRSWPHSFSCFLIGPFLALSTVALSTVIPNSHIPGLLLVSHGLRSCNHEDLRLEFFLSL